MPKACLGQPFMCTNHDSLRSLLPASVRHFLFNESGQERYLYLHWFALLMIWQHLPSTPSFPSSEAKCCSCLANGVGLAVVIACQPFSQGILFLQAGCVQRRAALSAALGLGNCDGKQLLRQLNVYGFSRQHVNDALASLRLPKSCAAAL